MIIKNIQDVAAQPVKMDGARDVTIRVLIGPQDNAPTFAMRLFELAPGGHTPFHDHNFEHEVIVLDGEIAVLTTYGPKPLQKNDVLLIDANEQHQFKNLSVTAPARFICLVPIDYQK
ncbi:MAG: cupin domain-containing protein [Phycisphaerae bacterium]|nr:cupin domain-containing protein [Phycisphaerae bacterium]